MKREFTIYDEMGLESAIRVMRQEFAHNRYLKVTASTDKPRSLPQNALVYQTYKLIAQANDQSSMREIRRRCKLYCGVPILRADDRDFQHAYDLAIKPLPLEIKLEVMDWWPVSSLMNTSQLTRYVNAMNATELLEARRAA